MFGSARTVYGGDTFYHRSAFRAAFFITDTLLLLVASGVDIYLIGFHNNVLNGPPILLLLMVLFGMWLLWWRAFSSHQKIRLMYDSTINRGMSESAMELLYLETASLTHIGMFTTFLLNAFLLIQIDSLIKMIN